MKFLHCVSFVSVPVLVMAFHDRFARIECVTIFSSTVYVYFTIEFFILKKRLDAMLTLLSAIADLLVIHVNHQFGANFVSSVGGFSAGGAGAFFAHLSSPNSG